MLTCIIVHLANVYNSGAGVMECTADRYSIVIEL